jgi:hypothetical protein
VRASYNTRCGSRAGRTGSFIASLYPESVSVVGVVYLCVLLDVCMVVLFRRTYDILGLAPARARECVPEFHFKQPCRYFVWGLKKIGLF